ncbi:sensor domain-containing diguanylate cyclase [Buttiauxella ferragutiae]|uniref:sensor domain-containing diguanylate cyclase n=1 Tax=Buttiauxella ferragutiae TaxID=82989 RepID=UPI003524CB2D
MNSKIRDWRSTFTSLSVKCVLLVIALFIQGGLGIYYLYLEHNGIEARVVQSLKNVSAMHLRSFEQLETTISYQLASVGAAVQTQGKINHALLNKTNILGVEVDNPGLDAIIILDKEGNIVASRSDVPLELILPPNVLLKNSFKSFPPYETFREINSIPVFSVSPKYVPEVGGRGMIMYKAIITPEGEFLGSVVGYTSPHSLSFLLYVDAMRGFDLGKDGILSIVERSTNQMLYRYIYLQEPVKAENIELQPVGSKYFHPSRYGENIKFYLSPIDGVERLVVLTPLHRERWIQLVGESKNEYLFYWRVQAAVSIAIFICLGILQGLLVNTFHKNQVQRKILEYDALHDPLTGLANRRQFFIWSEMLQLQSNRYNQPWCILALDIDHFKKINDTYGHDIGDKVLCILADILRSHIRDCDIAARFGGEEFIIGLPQTRKLRAIIVAERIRKTLAERIIIINEHNISCTTSIGVAEYQPRADMLIDDVLNQADKSLFRAKSSGRNNVAGAEPERK